MDKISCIIILRALFIFSLIERYYLVGDIDNGNREAEILIEGMNYEGYL